MRRSHLEFTKYKKLFIYNIKMKCILTLIYIYLIIHPKNILPSSSLNNFAVFLLIF